MAPELPPGFDHVMVYISNAEYVSFLVFDFQSARSLLTTVTRAERGTNEPEMITLDQAAAEPWGDPLERQVVVLPDDRRIIISCGFVAAYESAQGCPTVDGVKTVAEEIRAFTLALGTKLPVEALPEPDPAPRSVEPDLVRGVAATLVDQIPWGQGDEDPSTAATVINLAELSGGLNPIPVSAVTMRAYTGFWPPVTATGERRTLGFNGISTTWQPLADGSVWSVSWSPDLGDEFGDRVLDAAIEASAVPG